MSFTDKINADLKEAMKAKNEQALRGIRAIKAAILLANTDGSGQEMTDERALPILQKLVKQRKESLDIFIKQGREDLAVVEREEIAIIEKYLPAQMDEATLRKMIAEIFTETVAKDGIDMGNVMGAATKRAAGQADGKLISAIAKELLG